jgi:hypothetical protein
MMFKNILATEMQDNKDILVGCCYKANKDVCVYDKLQQLRNKKSASRGAL